MQSGIEHSTAEFQSSGFSHTTSKQLKPPKVCGRHGSIAVDIMAIANNRKILITKNFHSNY